MLRRRGRCDTADCVVVADRDACSARSPASLCCVAQVLEGAIHKINNHNAGGLSYEELYRCASVRSSIDAQHGGGVHGSGSVLATG